MTPYKQGPPSEFREGKGRIGIARFISPRFGEDQRDLGATQQAPRRRGGRSGQGQLYSMPARGWRRSCSQRRSTSGQIRQVQPALFAQLHEPAVSLGDAVVQTRPRERAQLVLEPRIVQVEGLWTVAGRHASPVPSRWEPRRQGR